MEPSSDSGRRTEFYFALGSIAVGAALVAVIPDLRHSVSLALNGNFSGLRHHFRGLGVAGIVLLLGLMLVHAVVFYPTEIVTATAGFVYGFAPGLALAISGWIVSGLFAYFLGRSLARTVLLAMFGTRRFGGLEQAVERGGVPLLLSGRFIPVVPFSLLCYAAGAARVGLWRFTWTTAVGFLPQCAAVAYLGSRAKSLSLNDPVLWAIVVLAVVLLLGGHWLGVRRRFRSGAER
jgi:uncharacterized membrane protein YdjX (TVP38/TMEM64 family)